MSLDVAEITEFLVFCFLKIRSSSSSSFRSGASSGFVFTLSFSIVSVFLRMLPRGRFRDANALSSVVSDIAKNFQCQGAIRVFCSETRALLREFLETLSASIPPRTTQTTCHQKRRRAKKKRLLRPKVRLVEYRPWILSRIFFLAKKMVLEYVDRVTIFSYSSNVGIYAHLNFKNSGKSTIQREVNFRESAVKRSRKTCNVQEDHRRSSKFWRHNGENSQEGEDPLCRSVEEARGGQSGPAEDGR